MAYFWNFGPKNQSQKSVDKNRLVARSYIRENMRFWGYSAARHTFLSKIFLMSEVTLYTLHPAPYTLRHTPYTLHPTPYTLHPTP